MEKNRVHFIGICGSAMAPIAVELKNIGFIVTGSDKGFFPPISTYLKNNNMQIQIGYKKEHIQSNIDFIVLGNAVGEKNIEFIEAKKRNIPILSYPEVLQKYLIKKDSIVVVGEYGKTTITSFLSFIFSKLNLDPSYMFGGVSLDMDKSVRITNSKYSIVEGDEYNASPTDKLSKFMYYDPKYLILTSLLWDHVDLFPQESDYINSFKSLVEKLPNNGVLFINEDDSSTQKIYPIDNIKIIKYSVKNDKSDYYGKIILYKHGYIEFVINGQYNFETQLIGDHNISNLTAGLSLCLYLGLDYKKLFLAVKEFRGAKRRLEIRYRRENLIVIDDFAHSPYKIKASIDAVRKSFPEYNIISVFEPHSISSRDKKTIQWYKGIFNSSDKVIVTDIYRKNSLSEYTRLNSEDIVNVVKSDVQNTIYSSNISLIESIESSYKGKDIILFMSSGSFQGMMDKYIDSL
jgi:UDP-N-acetylmuramate: L-alanyl-gamma-D-glutamyl-meso-diaminopimelate ligase